MASWRFAGNFGAVKLLRPNRSYEKPSGLQVGKSHLRKLAKVFLHRPMWSKNCFIHLFFFFFSKTPNPCFVLVSMDFVEDKHLLPPLHLPNFSRTGGLSPSPELIVKLSLLLDDWVVWRLLPIAVGKKSSLYPIDTDVFWDSSLQELLPWTPQQIGTFWIFVHEYTKIYCI